MKRTSAAIIFMAVNTSALWIGLAGGLDLFNISLGADEIKSAITETSKPTSLPSVIVDPRYRAEVVHGRVVWLASALKSEFGISTVPEVAEHGLAILTDEGKLLPIVENLRGRAFRKDSRLRDKQLELSVRIYEKHPLVQVVGIFELDEGRRYEIDYWCDVCAIVMYEAGPCSCCQDKNRMRKRPVENGETLRETIK